MSQPEAMAFRFAMRHIVHAVSAPVVLIHMNAHKVSDSVGSRHGLQLYHQPVIRDEDAVWFQDLHYLVVHGIPVVSDVRRVYLPARP